MCSVVRLLVESGADVNMKDEFSSADRVAFKERVSRLSGEGKCLLGHTCFPSPVCYHSHAGGWLYRESV